MRQVLLAVTVLAASALWLSAMQDKARSDQSDWYRNHNQAIKAMLMYANDSDDFFALADRSGISSSDWGKPSDIGYDSTWPAAVIP